MMINTDYDYDYGTCPRCRLKTMTDTPAGWYCHRCKMEFAEDDNGTTGYGDPARIAERNLDRPKRRR